MAEHKEIILYIVRHGECLGNVDRKLLDPLEDLLTDAGQLQAELLGHHLKDISFNHVYTSDFPRTAETCRGILKKSEKCANNEVNLELRIRERGYSGMFGAGFADAMKVLNTSMQSGTPYLNVEMPKSETVEEFENRIISFFTELIQTHRDTSVKEQSILIVSHGLTIQRLMVLLNTRPNALGLDSWAKNLFAEKVMRNTSYHKIILKISPGEEASSKGSISGHVEETHCRDHVAETTDGSAKNCNGNYSFPEEKRLKGNLNVEEQKVHYCSPA